MKLPIEEYREIARKVPILCVDGIILHKGRFLLVKRKNEPLKGKWWVPGGRMFKGETLESAFKRKMKEEIGLEVKIVCRLGYYEEVFDKNELEIPSVHTISVVFVAMPLKGKVKLDEQSSDYKWAHELPEDFKEQVFSL